jgi:hypothetical protein
MIVGAGALALEQLREGLRDLVDHRHRPATSALGRPDALDRVDAAHHPDCLRLEVDVPDAQRAVMRTRCETYPAKACEPQSAKFSKSGVSVT